MSGSSFEDRLRSAFDAEAAELERRRSQSATGSPPVAAQPTVEVHELPPPEPESESRLRQRLWVLPAAAAALLVVAAWLGIGTNAAQPVNEVVGEEISVPLEDVLAEPTASDVADPPASAAEPPQVSEAAAPEAPAAPPATVQSAPEPTGVAELFEAPDIDVPSPSPEEDFFYAIEEGDLLSTIAEKFNVTMSDLLLANPALNPNILIAGEFIRIPEASRPGEFPTPLIPPSPLAPPQSFPVVPGVEYCVSGIVSPDVLNLRLGPGIDWPVLQELAQGECAILATSADPIDGWRQVSVAGETGWVSSNFIAMRNGGIGPADPIPRVVCVQGLAPGDTLNVRTGPGIEFDIVAELVEGQCGTTQGDAQDGWIALGRDTLLGWAFADFLAPAPDDGSPSVVVSEVAEVDTTRIEIRLQPLTADAPLAPLSDFEVIDPGTGNVIGAVGADGSIAVPLDALPAVLRIEAELPNDPFCWWTGEVLPARTTDIQVLDVGVAELCS